MLVSLSTSTKIFLDMWSKHVDASLLRASALLFSPLGICLMVYSLMGSTSLCTTFTYFSILLPLASNSPLIWLAANLESARAVIVFVSICLASRRPTSKASYSASLFSVWKSKRRA